MKKKIAVLTATRSEYGLLRTIIKRLSESDIFDVSVLVTGAHLSGNFGYTVQEIEKDGFSIDKKVDILLQGSGSASISKSMGLALMGFGDYFEEHHLDYLMVLGDRYETLAVCCAAMNARIPIIHLHGGEVTEGAIDEAIRHSITKMSLYHFTSTEEYRRRVIQLGESPDRVFNVGAIGVENILHESKFSRKELEDMLNFDLAKSYGVVTFHPVTLEGDCEEQCKSLLKAMSHFKDYRFIITGANADCGGETINRILQEYANKHDNVYFTYSLGMKKYLSALNNAAFVLGNSSSGIIEAPSFGIPTINIGNRQKGRIQADSVINCDSKEEEIVAAIEKAMSPDFREVAKDVKNPYGNGETSKQIVNILEKLVKNQKMDLEKKFYDLI